MSNVTTASHVRLGFRTDKVINFVPQTHYIQVRNPADALGGDRLNAAINAAIEANPFDKDLVGNLISALNVITTEMENIVQWSKPEPVQP